MVTRRHLLLGGIGVLGAAALGRFAFVGQGVKASGTFPVMHSEAATGKRLSRKGGSE